MNTRELIINTALNITAEKGWNGLLLVDVARSCDMTFSALLEWFQDKTDILVGYGRLLDLKTQREMGQIDHELPLKDNLFDVLMTRIDLLSEHREAVDNILKSLKCEPISGFIILPHMAHSMQKVLEICGYKPVGMRGHMAVLALGYAYLQTLRAWMYDDSVDLSKTMAALDKNLGYFEKAGF